MTGLDCLREEMEKRGLTKSQCDSKVASVVLDILSNSDKNAGVWNKEQYESKKLQEIEREIRICQSTLKLLKARIEAFERDEEKAFEHRKHCEDYIDDFRKSIMECDSQEGRDSLRAAQMFVNSVSVETKYDNTAFIIGLAAILSKGGINAIDELKKVNKKLPDVQSIFDYEYQMKAGRRL